MFRQQKNICHVIFIFIFIFIFTKGSSCVNDALCTINPGDPPCHSLQPTDCTTNEYNSSCKSSSSCPPIVLAMPCFPRHIHAQKTSAWILFMHKQMHPDNCSAGSKMQNGTCGTKLQPSNRGGDRS
jgi:hypothetical protein